MKATGYGQKAQLCGKLEQSNSQFSPINAPEKGL